MAFLIAFQKFLFQVHNLGGLFFDLVGLFFDIGGLLVNLGLEISQPLAKLCRPLRLLFKSRTQGIILDLNKNHERRRGGAELLQVLFQLATAGDLPRYLGLHIPITVHYLLLLFKSTEE